MAATSSLYYRRGNWASSTQERNRRSAPRRSHVSQWRSPARCDRSSPSAGIRQSFSPITLPRITLNAFSDLSELEQQRREQRAVPFLDRRRRRPGLVIVGVGDLQLDACHHGRRQSRIEVIERIAEVAGLPERREFLRELAGRRKRPIEILAGF